MTRTPKKRGNRLIVYPKQWPDVGADKKTTPGDSVTPHLGHEYRLTKRFSEEAEMEEQTKEPKSAKETFGKRFKLTRAKHMPHPAPIKGGHYKSTPQMERPHYEEHERQMTVKTFTEAVNGFVAIVEGRKPTEAQHIIVQLEKHVRNQEMNPIIFKNGQKAKVGEALAHKAMKMHDSMSQGDKQQFVSHISKSVDHFKSGLKGAWKQSDKKGITLAGPKLRKEESDRPEQHTKTDVLVRKHTRLAADALGRAHHLGKDHKDYKKNMAEYERHRKIALGEESDHDDGWYAHKEMHGSKAISKEDWKKGIRPKKSMKKEEVEQVVETSQAKKDRYVERSASQASMANFTKRHATGKTKKDAENIERKRRRGLNMALKRVEEEAEQIEEAGKSKLQRYVNAAKPERHDPKKSEKRRAGISLALKKIIGSDAIGRKPRVKATMEEADQIDEWGMRSIRGPHAKTSSMAVTPPKVGYKGKTRKPKVQRIDTTPDKM